MSNSMRRSIVLLIVVMMIAAGCGQVVRERVETGDVRESSDSRDNLLKSGLSSSRLSANTNVDVVPVENENEDENNDNDQTENGQKVGDEEIQLPPTYDQPVAFAPQAPYAIWDELHEEACEEAAIIIAAKYFKGEKLDKAIMEQEINRLVNWEKEKLGNWKDTTAEETVGIVKDYFGLSARLFFQPTVDDIKRELASGKLIVAPTAGRMLDNPYFSGEGPLYHMLVIRGYDQTHFITNDPGTKRGEGFKYTYTNLLGSIHDWNHGNVRQGERVVIVISGQ